MKTKITKRLAALGLAMLMVLGMAACGNNSSSANTGASTGSTSTANTSTAPANTNDGQKYSIRIGHSDTTANLIHISLEHFAEAVKERTNGQVEVQIFASEQLGSNAEMVEMVEMGSLDAMMLPSGQQANYCPKFKALSLPFLFADYEHVYKVLDGEIGEELLEGLSDHNMIQLAYWENGLRQFTNNKREINTPADMQGLKIRVQESSMMMDMVKALGANPTPMPYGEVYSGLQTNVIDGAENNWPSYESTSHYEVAKYYVVDEHSRVPEMQIISKQTMDKLSADDQKIIRECAAESAKYERQLWAEREKASEEKVRAGGAVITRLSDAARAEFIKAVQPLYEKYGAEYKDLIQKIRDVK